jgi:hypothetical protein
MTPQLALLSLGATLGLIACIGIVTGLLLTRN